MAPSAPYFDLCLAEDFDALQLPALLAMGYGTVAFERVLKADASAKGGGGDFAPEPPVGARTRPPAGMTVLQRLTIRFSDPSVAHKMSRSENVRKYDLVAAAPTTDAALQLACASPDVDVIALDAAAFADGALRMNRRLYRRAVERGAHFELAYAPALAGAEGRRALVQLARACRAAGRSRNLLVASGARNRFEVRAPRDLLNLGLLLAMDEKQAERVLTANPKKTLLKAESRRRGKAPIFIVEKPKNATKRPADDDHRSPSKRSKIEE